MPSDRFQIAAQRAASSYPTEVWFTLSPSVRAAAIYRELRKLDAEAANASEVPSAGVNPPSETPNSQQPRAARRR
jgi:hypothetical protein